MSAPSYEYDFHSIPFGGFISKPTEDYTAVVRNRAAAGWRLSQLMIIPNSEGGARSIELVFERPATGPQDQLRADDAPSYVPEPLFKQPEQVRSPWSP